MKCSLFPALSLLALQCAICVSTIGDEPEKNATDQDATRQESASDVLAGHSYHGEAFNEGPRQQAYLMEGLGHVDFPVTTESAEAQDFITQAVAQLHGFWYFEAERSFRQAAKIDPDCAMAYWGMAMANRNNEDRADKFIAEATKRKDSTTRREQMYIEALQTYLEADGKNKKARNEKYTKALEKLLYEFPDDTEAKAFLVLQLWQNRSNGLPITSYLAVDALLSQIFAVEPMHPAHHYRIHLWDYERPVKALGAAARCGQSLPAIAHMWHMPGHTFSRLKRYDDAAWQQEASARVDHAHMMRDRVMPDQIHNFAHNNEWLIRNLNHVGRVRDAVDLAKNMIELPRHPTYNTLSKRGSAQYGRMRLFETLVDNELWDELIALCESQFLEPTDLETEQVKRLRHLGVAAVQAARPELADAQLNELNDRLAAQREERTAAVAAAEKKVRDEAVDEVVVKRAGELAVADAATARIASEATDSAKAAESAEEGSEPEEESSESLRDSAEEKSRANQIAKKKKDIEKAGKDAAKPFDTRIRKLEEAIQTIEGYLAIEAGDWKTALDKLKKTSNVDTVLLAELELRSGDKDAAVKRVQRHLKSNAKEVLPLARAIEFYWEAEMQDEAAEKFAELRTQSDDIDIDAPIFARLAPIAAELSFPADWRVASEPRSDVGVRPDLDSLGPFRWQPSPAPAFQLVDVDETPYSLKQFQGQPVLVIFYLGYGCLHCAEQLQAFAPKTSEFYDAGIQVLAISTDDTDGLKLSAAGYDGQPIPFPLLSNESLDIFRAYRAYDDFEQQPLHGTFLIDGDGLVRWQDISYEPFMKPDFLLDEAQRLLNQK